MARSTFKVLFYVNGSKEKNGIVPIMGRVTINGTVAQFSCKQSIPKSLWDVKGNKAKGKSREARDINLALDNIKAQIIKHYQRISDREAFVTAEMVRNAYQGIGSEYETLLDRIVEQAPHIRPVSFSFRQQASEPSFQHLEVGELTHPALLRYLQERGINTSLARLECRELHFIHNGKPYFAIGFPNVAGGYEVRNRFFKGCIAPKDISHIRQQGEPREKCLVFEGMTDYLSFLTLRMKNCPTMPNLDRQDYVVLNSVSNVSKAIDVLHGYGRIHCLLDNDEAGRNASRELEREFAGRIRDFSDNYKGHKDLNDYLCGKRQDLAVSPPPRTIVKQKKKGLGL